MDDLEVLRLLLLVQGYDAEVLGDIEEHICRGVLADREVVDPIYPLTGQVVCTSGGKRGHWYVRPLEYGGLFSERGLADQGLLFPLTPSGIWSAYIAGLAEKDKNEHDG